MKKHWRLVPAMVLLAVAVAAIYLLSPLDPKNPEPPALDSQTAEVDSTVAEPTNPPQSSASQASAASTTPAASEAEQLAALLATPVPFRDGGLRRDFQLSTTEVSIRGKDGLQKIVSLPPSGSPTAFAASLAKLRADHGTEPELVLYPVGLPQNESTRRIATQDVVITASSRFEADTIASSRGLVFKKAPAFSPNRFVYEAPNAAAALAAQTSPDSGIQVTPLIAGLAAKKAMPNDPYVPLQWHLKYQGQANAIPGTDINVESVWNYASASGNSCRGGNVTIGIVDDGMEWNHPDLAPNVLPELQWDWNGGDSDPSPNLAAGDDHGTACAGVAAARGNNRIGVSGVAPEASLVGLRLISGPATDLDEAEAMVWHKDQIEIKSNSWGPPDDGSTLDGPDLLMQDALRAATSFGRNGRGTIITWAGGNGRDASDNSNYDGYANSIYTLAVAAMDSDGMQASYSESGANIVVTAPSDGGDLGIMTTDNRGSFGYNPGFTGQDVFGSPDLAGTGDATKNFGGTSSATPVVSGVVALMLEKNPALGWRDVQEILMRSAKKVNPTDPDWKTSVTPDFINHSHKYGAGLVDTAAAVDLADGWVNLGAQVSSTTANNSISPIDAVGNSTITRTFVVTQALRTEHATISLNLPGIPKGDLEIWLSSPSGTTSIFCEPHADQNNEFDGWTFMTVRNWGENSVGPWTLTIRNNGVESGNLTSASLTVYGTQSTAPANPLPVVNLRTSTFRAFHGTPVTLSANAVDKNSNNTAGTIARVEFFSNNGSGPVSIGNATSTNSIHTIAWTPPAIGNYTLTATAVDNGDATSNSTSVSASSPPVQLRVDRLPVAAWDFDTGSGDENSQSPIDLSSAIQSSRQYSANFGSNNGTIAKILFDGTLGSSSWSVPNGEIWTGTGSAENFLADSNPFGANTALTLRAGKNRAASKSIVFELDMTQARRLQISYATEASLGGFTTHRWHYWDANSSVWRDIEDENGSTSFTVPTTFSEVVLDQVAGIGFNGRANARVRLTVSGATAVSGTNLIDNIRFNATVAP
jgi:subtilisin-like proprotein convertase family protein